MTRPIQYKTNPKGSEEWINSIGKFILNFSAIELQTYWWLGALKKDQISKKKYLNTLLKRRVNRIIELIADSEIDNDLQDEAIEKWREILELAKFRNIVCHNPLIINQNINKRDSILGIPDLQYLHRMDLNQSITKKSDFDKKVDRLERLANELYRLLNLLEKGSIQ